MFEKELEFIMDLFATRRSIRKYTSQEVEGQMVETLLKAAFFAPTARNLKPWHFLVIDDRQILTELAEEFPTMSMLAGAPLAIVVCGDSEISEDFWPDDCAAATQNILLCATQNGLGSCWCAVYPRVERMEGFVEKFQMPEQIKPYSLIALGYPDETKQTPERYDPARVHYNGFKPAAEQ